MRRLLIGIALAGVGISIALAVSSQMSERTTVDADSARVFTPSRQDTSAAFAPAPPAPESMPAAVPSSPAPSRDTEERPVISGPGRVPDVVTSDNQQQADAAILRKASAAYENVRSLRADFTQKRTNPLLGTTTTSRGTIYQRRPDRFLMKFSDPAGDVIVSDGRYFWIYYPSVDAKQVLRAPAGGGAAGAVDLQAQFVGDPLRRFQHTYHGTADVGGRNAHVFTLRPREQAPYRSLKVWIDARDSLVRRFEITEQSGVVQEFQLSNLSINPTLADALFAFTPPAGAQVIER